MKFSYRYRKQLGGEWSEERLLAEAAASRCELFVHLKRGVASHLRPAHKKKWPTATVDDDGALVMRINDKETKLSPPVRNKPIDKSTHWTERSFPKCPKRHWPLTPEQMADFLDCHLQGKPFKLIALPGRCKIVPIEKLEAKDFTTFYLICDEKLDVEEPHITSRNLYLPERQLKWLAGVPEVDQPKTKPNQTEEKKAIKKRARRSDAIKRNQSVIDAVEKMEKEYPELLAKCLDKAGNVVSARLAKQLEDHGYKFWPDSKGEPPLGHSQMSKKISEYLKNRQLG